MTHSMIRLDHALRANAAFSALSGLALLGLPEWWTALFGLARTGVFATLGAALLGFAALVVWTSMDTVRRAPFVRLIVAGDVLWVVATPVVMLLGIPLITAAGHVALVVVAAVVGALATVQWSGLRRQ